jgi:hypothetical protein
VSVCRSCRAPIEWAVTDNGRRMPLDLGLYPDGRIAIVGRREQTPVIVILNGDQLERLRAPGDVVVQLRRSHFQTCPDADSWRRA